MNGARLMELFCGSELTFGHTYFPQRQLKILRIKTDAPVQSLSSVEVPQSAGSYFFAEEPLKNRFILWRTDGQSLNLAEYSASRNLTNAQLSINFSQSLIIPGTHMFVHRNILALIVPTQSAIHRFFLHLPTPDNINPENSLLSLFYLNDRLAATHDYHQLRLNGIASKADVGVSGDGATVIAVCMADKQLVRIVFPFLVPTSPLGTDEVVLQGHNVLDRLFKKHSWPDTWDVVVATKPASSDALVYSVSRDGKIRVYPGSIEATTVLLTTDLRNFLHDEPSLNAIADVALRTAPDNRLLLRVQVADHNRFILLEHVSGKLVVRFTCALDSQFIVDFACTPNSNAYSNGNAAANGPAYCFWAVVSESAEEDENGTAAAATDEHQPYILKRCAFALTGAPGGCEAAFWENVQPAARSGAVDQLLLNYPANDAIRNRIFDGDNYSFGVVSRAIQISCKQPKRQFEYGRWTALSKYLDEYLVSAPFKQQYLADEDSGSLLSFGSTKLQAAYDRFWTNLLKRCNQFQETDTAPLALWHSDSLGLVGVIQLCRFSVYLPADERLRAICDPTNISIANFFDIVGPFLHANKPLSQMDANRTLATIANHTDELCTVIELFADHYRHLAQMDKSDEAEGVEVVPIQSDFLHSSLSISFLAMGLRHRIVCRLRLADVLNKLLALVPQILAISTEARVNPKLDLVISQHNSAISQAIAHYTTLWIALSVRLESNSDQSSGQINIAQAFFKFGGPTVKRRTTNPSARVPAEEDEDDYEIVGDEDDDGFEVQEDEEVSSDEDVGSYPRSKWDKSLVSAPGSQGLFAQAQSDPVSITAFMRFISEMLSEAVEALWPESKSLTLPRFLAKTRFFDALKNYCALNEPFISQLAYAFRFFQGIALSGQGRPDAAWRAFEEVAAGISAENDALNRVLLVESVSRLASPNATNPAVPAKKTHSLIEYYHKLMLLYKSHGHSGYVVRAGEKAVQCAREGDEQLLSEIYTTLFTQHLISGDYRTAIRDLLVNPDTKRQTTCLHQLVGHLLDQRQSQTLVNLCYEHLVDTVAEILEARCHSESVVGSQQVNTNGTNIYDVAYSFHVTRCEFAKAAKIMYSLASRLRLEVQSRELLQRRCHILAMVLQTLKIASPEEQTISCEVEVSDNNLGEDNQTISDSIDNEAMRNTVNRTPVDIGQELLKAEARLALVDTDPLALPPLADEDVLRELLRHKLYDMAWMFLKEFGLKPYSLLESITMDALRIDHEEASEDESATDWMAFNRQFVSQHSRNYKLHWRLAISYVDLALQLFPHDTNVLRTVAHTFLKNSIKIPTWLEVRYRDRHFGDFLRTLMDFNDLGDAFAVLLPEIEAAKRGVRDVVTRHIQARPNSSLVPPEELGQLLPYTHIDELLYLAKKSEDRSLPVNEALKRLQDLFIYQKRLVQNPMVTS